MTAGNVGHKGSRSCFWLRNSGQVAFSEEAACKLGRAEEETGPAPSTSQTSTVDVMVETPHVVCSLFCARLWIPYLANDFAFSTSLMHRRPQHLLHLSALHDSKIPWKSFHNTYFQFPLSFFLEPFHILSPTQIALSKIIMINVPSLSYWLISVLHNWPSCFPWGTFSLASGISSWFSFHLLLLLGLICWFFFFFLNCKHQNTVRLNC